MAPHSFGEPQKASMYQRFSSAISASLEMLPKSPTKPSGVPADAGAPGTAGDVQIIDIRRSKLSISLKDDILAGILGKNGSEKSLPTLLLYSAHGLKIFEDITYSKDYYLTNAEIAILEKYAESIAERLEDGGILVELGSGNLRKVNILLQAIDRLGKKLTYYALDLDLSELNRTLSHVPPGTFKNIQCVGLHGTYDDGRVWLKESPLVKHKSKCILWLGSSIGNFAHGDAAIFLKEFTGDVLRADARDFMIVGLDGCKNKDKVFKAYNDSAGVTREFILEGLNNANEILGKRVFIVEDWDYVGEWNEKEGRHQAYYVPKRDICLGDEFENVTVKRGEKINIEYSYKFDRDDAHVLWGNSGLMEGTQWTNEACDYYLAVLYRPSFTLDQLAKNYAAAPTPTPSDWNELWASWDMVTLGMIPKEQLSSKPINLRNPCIFYLGHIPTFLDVQLTRATGQEHTGPREYQDIFQRGIDPDVDNPEQCHAHSVLPESWPALEEILEFTKAVRERTMKLYDQETGRVDHQTILVQRALWLSFEHEAMHLETLLYMLIQSDKTLPPPNVPKPDFTSEGALENRTADESNDLWVKIPARIINIGMDDPEVEDTGSKEHNPGFFGWDNEKPLRKGVEVEAFKARAHPITNEEYAKYLFVTSSSKIPASWQASAKFNQTADNTPVDEDENATNKGNEAFFIDSLYVKTVFGPVPLKFAFDWPVMASYDELLGCVNWMGGRIPTANEVRAIYDSAEETELAEKTLAGKIDAVNGHLINDGVTETPPSDNSSSHTAEGLETSRQQLFINLEGGHNVGFKNWHPTSVRPKGLEKNKLRGRGNTGGAWEWTSTELAPHEGFIPEKTYPEYTTDFFDGKHNVVLGGSWATNPRIAGRKSAVNWYQRNYPYTWATARIVALD